MTYSIIHQPDQSLFKVEIDGRTAFAQYRLINDSLDILRVMVPKPLEGQGVASALVKAAYNYAAEHQLRAKATCSYAVKWLERHPELVD